MRLKHTMLLVAGALGIVTGFMGAVPAFAHEEFILSGLAILLAIVGFVIVAIVLGDYEDDVKRILLD